MLHSLQINQLRYIANRAIWLAIAMAMPLLAQAKFRVIDADTNEPLTGAYVYNRQGRLLQMTGADGVVSVATDSVTISMMSYESQTVDAATQTADVVLKPRGIDLGEVVVNQNDYVKTSAVFRDAYRNDGKLVLYREGLVDFYYDCNKKKYTRRVRACRQWVDPRLDKMFNFSLFMGPYHSTHLGKVKYVKRDGVTGVTGDSTYYAAKGGDKDAILCIADSVHGTYRVIIDNLKVERQRENPIYTDSISISEWTYKSERQLLSELISHHSYADFTYKNPVKGFKKMDVMMNSELVVTGIRSMPRQEAKTEMKDKKETREFTMPDILPQLPFSLEAELQGMKPTKFDEY